MCHIRHRVAGLSTYGVARERNHRTFVARWGHDDR